MRPYCCFFLLSNYWRYCPHRPKHKTKVKRKQELLALLQNTIDRIRLNYTLDLSVQPIHSPNNKLESVVNKKTVAEPNLTHVAQAKKEKRCHNIEDMILRLHLFPVLAFHARINSSSF